jgi:phage terminase large subunit-like protein
LDRATQFAKAVVNGTIKRRVGHLEYLACNRHLKDLERQGTADFPYIWSATKANDLLDFAENLIIAEGDKPEQMVLYDFQCFIFGSWNGWVHKDTGYRRFRTSYEQVARQNGKSIGNAVPSLYYGNFDGYRYPQIYATATKEAQARIVLKECIKFIDADQELSGTKTRKGLFTVKDYKSEVVCNITRGVIKALGRDTKTIDGFRPYYASVDEYHLHKDNQMYKLLSDGTKKLKQCLISVITTAGFDINGPCKELYDYCVNILKGAVMDETQFVYITQLDKDDDLWDPENWQKANPLWTDQTLDSMKADAVKAKQMQGEELRNFMTKGLNKWVQLSDEDYINVERWKENETSTTFEDMRGMECGVGLDLSSGGDLTSLAFEFELPANKYFVDSHSFIPKNRFLEHELTDRAPYTIWRDAGLVEVTETLGGVKTDYKYIIAYMRKIQQQYGLKYKFIAYDPHNADAFLQDLDTFGCDCIEIIQSAKNLNGATEDFKLTVDSGAMTHDKNNGLLTWSAANAKLTYNSFGECKIDKNYNFKAKRIDPMDAIIDVHKIMIEQKTGVNPNDYAQEDFLKKLWGV